MSRSKKKKYDFIFPRPAFRASDRLSLSSRLLRYCTRLPEDVPHRPDVRRTERNARTDGVTFGEAVSIISSMVGVLNDSGLLKISAEIGTRILLQRHFSDKNF